MKTHHFIKQIGKRRLVSAIQEAERGNSGDVVLFICHRKVDDAMTAAREVFDHLKLEQTTPQNSVLIFLAPESQRLAVIGGTDLYRALPPEWWSRLIATMTRRFVQGHHTEGLLDALREIGEGLRKFFPVIKELDRSRQTNLLEGN